MTDISSPAADVVPQIHWPVCSASFIMSPPPSWSLLGKHVDIPLRRLWHTSAAQHASSGDECGTTAMAAAAVVVVLANVVAWWFGTVQAVELIGLAERWCDEVVLTETVRDAFIGENEEKPGIGGGGRCCAKTAREGRDARRRVESFMVEAHAGREVEGWRARDSSLK